MFSSNRAFVQWAGMTAGLSQSFYDFFSGPAVAYRAGYFGNSDTGDAGWFTWAYTAQLGGGFSATLAAENAACRRSSNSAAGAANVGSIAGSAGAAGSGAGVGYGGMQSLTTSPTSGSTKPGVARRSWAQPTSSILSTSAPRRAGGAGRQMGLRSRCWSEAQYADDHSRRLVPGTGQLYGRCCQVHRQRQ